MIVRGCLSRTFCFSSGHKREIWTQIGKTGWNALHCAQTGSMAANPVAVSWVRNCVLCPVGMGCCTVGDFRGHFFGHWRSPKAASLTMTQTHECDNLHV